VKNSTNIINGIVLLTRLLLLSSVKFLHLLDSANSLAYHGKPTDTLVKFYEGFSPRINLKKRVCVCFQGHYVISCAV